MVPYLAGTDNIFGDIVISGESVDNNNGETENAGERVPEE